MSQITLQFSEHRSIALDAVKFSHPLLSEPRISCRGKGLSDFVCRYTFQWSPAVRAMSILFLRTKANDIMRSAWPLPPIAALVGSTGSCAASLDYALSKKPLWLLDMFGVNAQGTALARLLFTRWNSERKRGGDVIVAINPLQLIASDIQVVCNKESIDAETCLSLARALDRTGRKPQVTHAVLQIA